MQRVLKCYYRWLSLAWLFALWPAPGAQAAPFIRAGSTWRYLDTGTNAGTAWRTLEFEDDGWASGPAQLGYGDGDEQTEVGFGPDANNKYITTYFRHKFTVLDAGAVTNLILRLLRDDGAIVYLNNVEVRRSNMPDGPVTHLTLASASISGSGEDAFSTVTLNPALLVTGDNIVAVEIHQDDPDSSDISFDLELTDGNNDAPNVTIVSPANNALLSAPGPLAIQVTATDPNGTVTNVQVYSGNTRLAEKSSPPWTFTWTNAMPGAHVLTARARDNDGIVTVSASAKITIGLGVSNRVLVPLGAVWKYLDDGSNQGTAWRSPVFDDATWAAGPSRLGYGEGGESTLVRFGASSTNKHVTTYFRHRFVVEEAGTVPALVARLHRDDGAVVYLNGVEVFRSNMPTGTIGYLTFAAADLGSPEEDQFVRATLDPAGLVSGTNLLAVEVHQATRTSGDLSFNLELLGSDLPALLRGPFLQTPTQTNIIVKWRTDASVVGRVRYGHSPFNLSLSVTAGSAATDHRIELRNLVPNTRYYYGIGTTNGMLLSGPDYYFETLPPAGAREKTRFWVLGDCGSANADQFNVRDAFYRALGTNDFDFMLLLGDNAYNAGTDSEYQRAIFDTYPTMLRNKPMWSTIGNHETDQSSSPSSSIPYYQIYSLPRDGEAGGEPSGTEDYYSWDFGNIHFVCLDAMTSSRATNGSMANWLQADLAATTQDWIIAYWHHPPYTKGSHDSDDETQLIEMRRNFLPILEAYGVDLVLCGHSHCYERSHLLNGHYGSSSFLSTAMKLDSGGGRPDGAGAYLKPLGASANRGAVYVVAGSAGKVSGGSLNHPAMFTSLNRLGSLYVEVEGDRLDAWFIRETGLTNDWFTILKGPAVTVADVAVTEPDAGTSPAPFQVRLSEASAAPVTLTYQAMAETAALDVDFHAIAGTVTFQPGETNLVIPVPVVGDLLVETNESFRLALSGTPLLARTAGRGMILDNDGVPPPAPQFTSVLREGETVTLSWPGVAGRTYQVEFKDDLNAPTWQAFPQAIPGVNGPLSFSDIMPGPQRFYRVRVE